jgi:hypothetical protein
MWVDEFENDVVNRRLAGPAVWVDFENLERVRKFVFANFSGSHYRLLGDFYGRTHAKPPVRAFKEEMR